MDLENLIYKRKSCRKYLSEKLSDDEFDKIKEFISNVKVLNESIYFHYEILTENDVNLKTRWSAPYYLALYSENRENYKENIGFVFQQVSLYMQSLNIGSCWVGMGSPKIKKDNFIILIAFGKSNDLSRNLEDFKRKKITEFIDFDDDKLLPAYYAPSAVNSQPWFFKHNGQYYDMYMVQFNFVKRKLFGKLNPIDIGICLAHLYIANQNSFKFEIHNDFEEIRGYTYIGSIFI